MTDIFSGFSVAYEACDFVVIEKPPGVHSVGGTEGEVTAATFVRSRYRECADASPDPRDAGLVQRLDKETSGLMVAARSRDEWLRLRGAFAREEVEKHYTAVVAGALRGALCVRGLIGTPYRRGAKVRVYRPGSLHTGRGAPQEAVSVFEPVRVVGPAGPTLVGVTIRTGRRHQIRAHASWAGHPLVGDELYGGPGRGVGGRRFFLHADRVTLPLPDGEGSVTVRAGDSDPGPDFIATRSA